MKLDLSSFLDSEKQSYHFEGELESNSFSVDDIKVIEPIKFSGEIFKVDGNSELFVTINYTYESNCDRCLKPTTSGITTNLSGRLMDNKGKNNDEDDVEEIIYIENSLLNIDEYIWSQVVSSLPMKILCSNDCKGLCPQCGQNLNIQSCDCMGSTIDPRLEKLKELFPKK